MLPLSDQATSNITVANDELLVSVELAPMLLNNSNATYTLCVQAGVYLLDSIGTLISMEETLLTVSADLTAGFFLVDSSIDKEEAKKANETTSFIVDSCICSLESCIENPVIVQEESYQVCIFAPSGMKIESFLDYTVSQNDIEYNVISNSATDSFTKAVPGSVGVIQSKIIAMFFLNITLPDVKLYGN